ncbi:MAG TPA: hypothetical protein VJ801_10895, partial [Polyangia bacterium]|nr:hypothetical protein [Polyangia bacterium]
MKHLRLSTFVALALVSIAFGPAILQRWEASRVLHGLEGLGAVQGSSARLASSRAAGLPETPDPALVVRVEEPSGFVASWQTVGGCGAGSGGGSSVGLKWIGRNVTGGPFNVQEQVTYTKLVGETGNPEYNLFFNTLISADIGQTWSVGVNLPLVYKYLVDPKGTGDFSNSGLGDISLLATLKLGRIKSWSLTGIHGFPTGVHDAQFNPTGIPIYLNSSQQIGFGKWTGSLILDHTMDQMWGLIVLGGAAAWRGGKNNLDSYRAPSGTVYGYAGYFLGPLVPAFGLSLTGFTGHDTDQNAEQPTPLVSLA